MGRYSVRNGQMADRIKDGLRVGKEGTGKGKEGTGKDNEG